ncbi:long-chain fatty acid--CoA ligase, partial [Luminiphilus sp.]|nr:long-chain fatty acid--CoA ligase [Luminiphilus sp.]
AVGCGSAAPSPSLLAHHEQALNISNINMFGANEGTLLCSDKTLIPDPNDRATLFPRVGLSEVIWSNSAANWLSSRLLDVDTGEEITCPDRTGMLLVKGLSIFPGYFRNGVLDRSSFTEDGFFKTGDLF